MSAKGITEYGLDDKAVEALRTFSQLMGLKTHAGGTNEAIGQLLDMLEVFSDGFVLRQVMPKIGLVI